MEADITLDIKEDTALSQRPRVREACLKLQQLAVQLGPEAKLPTMIELRSQLGMSLGTLNDAVRELERRGILRSASGVGVYVAEPVQTRKTGKLGLLFRGRTSSHPHKMDLLSGVQREAARNDLEIVLLDEATEIVEPGKVDALLMYCHVTEALLMKLPENLPHALLFQHSPEFTCIAPDDFEGAKMITRHLLESGHRRIASLWSSDHDSISQHRLAGYHAAHQQAGMTVQGDRVKFLQRDLTRNYLIAGEKTMARWLEQGWRDLGCTAIVAHNDDTAIGVMRVLTAAGLRVPEDVSVVGFDGTEVSDLCTPRLTTVKVPLEEIGTRAVKVLLEQMKDGVFRTEKIVLPVQLKLGESTAPVLNSISNSKR